MHVSTALALLVFFALGFLFGALWVWLSRRRKPRFRHPDRFNEPALATEIGVRLAGSPADGSEAAEGAPPNKVIWVDAGDEVLVHLDSTRVKFAGQTLLVSVDLETDQTGRAPVIVAFALGSPSDKAGLVATTDEVPHGHPLLVSRWGPAVRASVWNSLLGMAEDHATERRLAATGITAQAGRLVIGVGEPLRVAPRRAGGQ